MWEKINKILKGQVVTSIIYIVFGVCLVCMPVNMINVICKFVFGILLILVGLYHILIYVAEKLSATIFDLFSGGVLLVVGVFLFMNPQIVIKLLRLLRNLYSGRQYLDTEGKLSPEKKEHGYLENPSDRQSDLYWSWYCACSESLYHGKIYGDLCRIYFPCKRDPGPDFHDP